MDLDNHKSKPTTEPVQGTQSSGTDSSNHAASSDWNSHEHQSDRVRIQAQQLVQEVGSPELAKHVIDEVAHHNEPSVDQTSFAHQFGFESYLAMFEASTPLTSEDGRSWLVATTSNGHWIAWSEGDLSVHHRFHSLEEAAKLIGAEQSPLR